MVILATEKNGSCSGTNDSFLSNFLTFIYSSITCFLHVISYAVKLSSICNQYIKVKMFILSGLMVSTWWHEGNFIFVSFILFCRMLVAVYIYGWKCNCFYIAVLLNCVKSHSLFKTSQYVLFGSSTKEAYHWFWQ